MFSHWGNFNSQLNKPVSVEENIKRLRGQSLMENVLFTSDVAVFSYAKIIVHAWKQPNAFENVWKCGIHTQRSIFMNIFLCGMFRFNMRRGHSCTLMKVFSHPSHAYCKCYVLGNWTVSFTFKYTVCHSLVKMSNSQVTLISFHVLKFEFTCKTANSRWKYVIHISIWHVNFL